MLCNVLLLCRRLLPALRSNSYCILLCSENHDPEIITWGVIDLFLLTLTCEAEKLLHASPFYWLDGSLYGEEDLFVFETAPHTCLSEAGVFGLWGLWRKQCSCLGAALATSSHGVFSVWSVEQSWSDELVPGLRRDGVGVFGGCGCTGCASGRWWNPCSKTPSPWPLGACRL